MSQQKKQPHVAFLVGEFPGVPGAFILNQVADLIDRGVKVTIFALSLGSLKNVSDRYYTYEMEKLVRTLEMPSPYMQRIVKAIPKMINMLRKHPASLFRALNIFRYGKNAASLKMIFWSEPFINQEFDLMHCHYGPLAVKYLGIKDVVGITKKIIVTLYGYDVSHIVRQKGIKYYERLAEEASLVFVMSENMKSRAIPLGFDPEKLITLPISIDVSSYPFAERAEPRDGEPIRFVSAGRFVEKKGFDDLLRSLAIVKKKTKKKFLCHIVGDGVEGENIRSLAKKLDIEDHIVWEGFMKEQDLVTYYMDKHLYIQTSKTARNGDME